MKKFPLITLIFTLCLCLHCWAESPKSALDYLNAMVQAHRQANYEQLYLFQQGENVESLRYRHAYHNNKQYAQLLQLDGAREEIILRDDMVSYFGDFQPFSLKMSAILDNLPAVLYTDFDQLKGYSFVDAGRMRVADRIARVIRIIPHDDFRYQYQVWIDEQSNLLLRSDLLDRDNNVLEQFRVVQSLVEPQFLAIVSPIESLILPAMIQTNTPSQSQSLTWQPKWVPEGFKQVSAGRQNLSEILMNNESVESQQYNDGLFSFTIYELQNKGVLFDQQFWRDGKTSIYSQTVGDKDIVIIGEIPLISAQHIIQEIQQKEINQ